MQNFLKKGIFLRKKLRAGFGRQKSPEKFPGKRIMQIHFVRRNPVSFALRLYQPNDITIIHSGLWLDRF